MFSSLFVRCCAVFACASFVAVLPIAGSAQNQPIVVPVVLPLTGPAAFVGSVQKSGLEVFEGAINKAGGIAGRQLKFDYEDDQTNPSVDVQLFSHIIAAHSPVAFEFGLGGSVLAVLPLIKDGPTVFAISPTAHPEAGSFGFVPTTGSVDVATSTAHFAKKRGWKKIAFLLATDATGIDTEKQMVAAFAAEAKDTKIVDIEHFAVGDLSFAAQIAKIKGSEPDALFIAATGAPAVTALRSLNEAGVTDLSVMTLWSNAIGPTLNLIKPYMPKELLMPGPPSLLPQDQLPAEVRQASIPYFRAFAAAGVAPDPFAGFSWDVGSMIVSAYRKLGPNATAAQFREYIAGLSKFPGVSGNYDFKAIPQHGIDARTGLIVVRVDPARSSFTAVSGFGGF